MPGYLIHFATCQENLLKDRSFVLGVEAPDLLKKHYKTLGKDKAMQKYNKLKTPDMPDYSRLKPRIIQAESLKASDGLHFGVSSSPNVLECWNHLTKEERNAPFFRGYLWHLITDLVMYNRLNIDEKLYNALINYKGEDCFETLKKRAKTILHEDWDKINFKIKETYPSVPIPTEIEELGVVKFISHDEPVYIDWETVNSTIVVLRNFNPMCSESELKYIIDIISMFNS